MTEKTVKDDLVNLPPKIGFPKIAAIKTFPLRGEGVRRARQKPRAPDG